MIDQQFRCTALPLSGCLVVHGSYVCDHRGVFAKTFRADHFSALGLHTEYAEEYYTISQSGVLRGMHFQIPPMDVIKLVSCLSGSVMDVLVDIRVGSPTYGQYAVYELSAELNDMIYIPSGIAHGFYVHEGPALLTYKVSKVYNKECDTGIRWDSASIPWPESSPILSARDLTFISLTDYCSPFHYRPCL